MAARMECVLEESVEDRICRTVTEDGYELQEGTPTPPAAMLENETICAIFHGNIRPDVQMVNDMYGVNFRFYCERPRRLEFDVKVLDVSEDSFSMVELYPGPRENYHAMTPMEIAEPATPLAIAGITTPRKSAARNQKRVVNFTTVRSQRVVGRTAGRSQKKAVLSVVP
ncbi:PREDICTED: uncharacterized protein LOC109471765 [Branchiostoma belcheri]|uniref:Uncharacterized protein LOC109471765 n=1 Tax=Branchiostoma belcheri TaxID=7741 RepID=A0A6P4YC26_BRABE|nr:PREDICTED: uncharacterized protein LOC109471765 [Branchiostoma belcheri]